MKSKMRFGPSIDLHPNHSNNDRRSPLSDLQTIYRNLDLRVCGNP